MSLEQELMRNTEALIALTAALSKTAIFPIALTDNTLVPVENTLVPVEKVKSPKPAAAVVAATPPAVSTPSAPAAMLESPVATASATIEYAQVAAAIVATFKVDRVKVIDALSRFGVTKGPQLRPEDYAEFLAMLEDAPA